MTEKRFTVDDGLENVLCWEINDKENEDMTCGECVKLLNELHEENQALKKQNKMLRTNVGKLTDDVKYLRNLPSIHQKENEQLKKKLNTEKPILDYFHNRHYYIRDMTTEEIKKWNKIINKVMCE